MRLPIVAVTIAVAAVAGSLGARVSARPQDDPKYIARMQEVAPRLEKDPALFDGDAIPGAADLAKVERYLSLMGSAISVADEQYRRLSPAGRQHPTVVRIMARREEAGPYHAAGVAALKAESAARKDRARAERDAAKQRGARARALCEPFKTEALESDWQVTSYAVSQVWHYKTGEYKSAAEVGAARAALARVHAACARAPDLDDGCYKHGVGGDNFTYKAPTLCEAAAHADQVLALGVTNYIVNQGSENGVEYPELSDVEKRSGWLSMEGKVTYATHLYFTDAEKQRLRAKYRALLAAAGLEDASDETLWGKQVEYRAALRELVDGLAPRWSVEGSKCTGYGCKTARAQIASWDPGAKVYQVTLESSDWQVNLDVLQRPESRSKEGYILFQVPGARWCQLRSFTWEEPHRGGGKFARARFVTIGYVRFQRCR